MESLRNGKGRWDFIRDLNVSASAADIVYLRDHAPPDTIFEFLEASLVSAGEQHFLKDNSIRPERAMECRRRRELLRRRVELRGQKLKATVQRSGTVMAVTESALEVFCEEVDAELKKLSSELQREQRRCLRRHRARLVEEAAECWQRRRTAEAMTASRRAARCRFGPKRRDARLACSSLPTSSEWLDVWRRPGAEGGMQVETLEWDRWRLDREGPSYDYDPADTESVEAASQDLKDLRKYMVSAPKRKTVPEGTAPLELWHMALFPKWRVQGKFGLGLDISPPDNRTFWFLLSVGLQKVRRHQLTPLYWHKSQAAALHKSHKAGPLGKRVVHILPAVGKGFYAKKIRPSPTVQDHGFVSGRRREEAVMISMNTMWRMRAASRTHCACFKDLSNAFASTTHDEMDSSVVLHCHEHNVELCKQRYHNSVIVLPSSTGELVVRPRQGGTMGDPFIVTMFLNTFTRPILSWGLDSVKEDMCAKELVSAWGDIRADLSLMKYADDLHKFVLASPNTTLGQFLQKLSLSDDLLNTHLLEYGFGQNMKKQEFMFFFSAGGHTSRQYIRDHPESLSGTARDAVRYLGPHLVMRDTASHEVDRRLQAARVSFHSLGGVWSLPLPYRFTRLLLIGFAQNTILSGMEAFILSKNDYDKLDRGLAAMGRIAMRGKACTREEDKIRSMSTSQVLSFWKLAPSSIEMSVRRLRLYQGWARDYKNHVQVLCSLFGEMPLDKHRPQLLGGGPT
eukprot:8454047-Pyramimonas_sp.AAC.1